MIHCDIKTCVGCRMCEVICSSAHFRAVSPALSRIRVAKLEAHGLDLAIACLSCLEKPCLDCPKEALTAGHQGEIRLDSGLCDSCGVCVESCPIGAIGFHDGRPLLCDLCDGATLCVGVCPSGSLSYREGGEGVSLRPSLQSSGNPAQKRALYARALGNPLREAWKRGGRVDS